MNIITGDKFMNFCTHHCDRNHMQSKGSLHQVNYMYVEGHNFSTALYFADKYYNVKWVIVSHNSDANIIDHEGRDFDYCFVESNIPKNVKMIFAQNLNVLSKIIRPLPIGIENWKWHKGQKWVEIESMAPQKFKREKWLYVNHAIATNPEERTQPYNLFKNKGFATVKSKISFLEYLTDLKKHRFRICPFGNGLDTHSIWETLYMDCVPIVKKAIFTEIFQRLVPMIIVNDWSEVTLKNLEKWYYQEKQWKECKARGEYDALNFDWWIKVIKGEVRIG